MDASFVIPKRIYNSSSGVFSSRLVDSRVGLNKTESTSANRGIMFGGLTTGTGIITRFYTMTEENRYIGENDIEILAMTDVEIAREARAAFGSWSDHDDITDEWLENIRESWWARIDGIYDPDDENPSI